MNILALDLSLTETGFAFQGRSGILTPPKVASRGAARLAWFRNAVHALATNPDVHLAVLEGYSFGQARGSSHHHALGEMGGVVRLTLHDLDIPFVEVPPACLKKLATGKGNARKEEVLAAAIRRLDYGGSNNNTADALWLLEAALQAYGLSTRKLPTTHLDALAKVEWPALGGVARPAA